MPVPPPITLERHSVELSPEETEEVVEIVSDLLVGYLKRQGDPARGTAVPQEAAHD